MGHRFRDCWGNAKAKQLIVLEGAGDVGAGQEASGGALVMTRQEDLALPWFLSLCEETALGCTPNDGAVLAMTKCITSR